MFWLWTLLIYGLLFFVATYIVVEVAQKYFYDEVVKYSGLRIGAISLLLAGALTWWNPSSLDLVTVELGRTALIAVAAFVLYVVGLQFHPQHALLTGPATIVLVSLAAAMACESLSGAGDRAQGPDPFPRSNRPVRRPAGGISYEAMKEGTEEEQGESTEGIPSTSVSP